jgi:RNA polymerase sigma-70 factor (ECF subfamily)
MQVVDLQETIESCLGGSQDGWRALFDGHASVVFHVLRGLGASAEVAEDIIGDVFLQLIEDRGDCLSRARFSDERQFRRWLIVLAKHRFLDAYRHERAARAVDVDETTEYELAASTAAAHDPTEQLLDDIGTRTEVERIMAAVSPRERLLVKLFYFHELRMREIADLTGTPLGAVSGAITRAREKMRRGMQQNDDVTRSMNRGEKPGSAPAGHGDAAEVTP